VSTDATLAWLLGPDEPSVRYLALKELLGRRPDGDRDVVEARRALMERGSVAAILSRQNEDGGFVTPEMIGRYDTAAAETGYQPKYKNSTWQLLFLTQLGADGDDPRVKRLCEYVLDHNYITGLGALGIHIQWRAGIDNYTLPCFMANMVWSLSTLGYAHDRRVRDTLQWLLKYQRFGGGGFQTPDVLPYRGKSDRCFGSHTCFSGVTRALNAVAIVSESERTGEMDAFIDRAVDFVILHRLWRKNYGNWKTIRPEYGLFTSPLIHYDDVISIVDTLQRLGVKHEAVDDGLEFIRSKRGPDGRWKLGYTMSRSATYANFGQREKPIKWITPRALKVLKISPQLSSAAPGFSILPVNGPRVSAPAQPVGGRSHTSAASRRRARRCGSACPGCPWRWCRPGVSRPA
jgi:hypothetical protein